MSNRGMAFMWLIAVASGLVAAVGIYRHLMGAGVASAQKTPPDVSVVIAAETLARGTTLTGQHLETTRLPRDEAPGGTFAQPESVMGRLVKEPIPRGVPIRQGSLIPVKEHPPLPAMVDPGYRAIGVFIDPRGGIQHFLQAGDHVDVVVTMSDGNDVTSARVLLQDIEVLAVVDRAKARITQPRVRDDGIPVTLSVTPSDAEKLSLAMQVGTIQLLVRNYADRMVARTSGVTRDTLLPLDGEGWLGVGYGPRQAADRDPALTYRAVELIKGRQRSRHRFPESAVPHGVGDVEASR